MKKKDIYLLVLWLVLPALYLFESKIEGIPINDQGFGLGITLVGDFFVWSWCVEHAKFLNVKPPRALLIILLGPIGVLYHFFKSFGLKGGFFNTYKATVFLIIITVTVLLVDELIHTLTAQQDAIHKVEADKGFKEFDSENYEAAFNKLHDLASLDNMDAQARVAWMYLKGKGVEQNNEQAVFWYTKAAEQDDITAQYHLATLYDQGEVVQQNTKEAVKWYTRAAESGNINSQYLLGFMYFNDESIKDYKESIKWYKMAAKQGNTIAQYNLASMYYYGNGVVVNYKKAFEWFQKSANQNDASAQNVVASMYADGLGVDKDYTEAHAWYIKSAEQGNPDAQVNLADMYAQGNGVDVDIEKAKYWLRKADENDDIKARELLDILENIKKTNYE